jgi:hypothetical protein
VKAALVASLLMATASNAHSMVADHGTINLSGTGAYMVVSLSVLAFDAVDDDLDGLLSSAELNAHQAGIRAHIDAGLQLFDRNGARPLQGVMLSLSGADGHDGHPAADLIVLGRFDTKDSEGDLWFASSLWGPTTRSLTMTITKNLRDDEPMLLTPQQPKAPLFASTISMVGAHLQLGARHVWEGLDHLLFLMVVVASGWRWRSLLLAMTVFTIGHAVSLIAVVLLGWTGQADLVEPAIAGTIMGLAVFDLWALRRTWSPPLALRLLLVFGCALIHGLGLGRALADIGLNAAHQGSALFGFNLGIELGQLSCAVLPLAILAAVHKHLGESTLLKLQVAMMVVAIVVGFAWCIERITW